jgi:hypothetical protein
MSLGQPQAWLPSKYFGLALKRVPNDWEKKDNQGEGGSTPSKKNPLDWSEGP